MSDLAERGYDGENSVAHTGNAEGAIVRSRHVAFEDALALHFPGAVTQDAFLAATYARLAQEGFSKDNTLACVALCRDEITVPLVRESEKYWGHAFSLASLAGMVTAGRTGLGAAMAHAPTHYGRQHIVLYAMPHIAIATDGTVGSVVRPGQANPSTACGALVQLRSSVLAGTVDIEMDRFDVEQSLIRSRLVPLIPTGDIPSLVDLTTLTVGAIEDDLTRIVADLIDEADLEGADLPDYAMFVGVQIHGPDGSHYVWPKSSRLVVSGVTTEVSLP